MNPQDDFKERVKEAVDLAEFIGRELELKRTSENNWEALCPFHQEKTPSFTVFRKEGHWAFHCFGCGATGDVFEWVMRREGCDFPKALQYLALKQGMTLPTAGERMYQPPEVREAGGEKGGTTGGRRPASRGEFNPEKFRALTPGSRAFEYLTGVRKLPAQLLTDYSVGQTVDGEAYSFAYKWRPANYPANRERALFEFCKVVKVDRPDGKKIEWREPTGGKNILFGMEAPLVRQAHEAGGELVISEGEIDAVTWAFYGFAAVSVPGGAKYLGWIDYCYEWLQAFKKIHISFDEDAAGRGKVVEIVKRLGIARTDIVRLPQAETGPNGEENLRQEQQL